MRCVAVRKLWDGATGSGPMAGRVILCVQQFSCPCISYIAMKKTENAAEVHCSANTQFIVFLQLCSPTSPATQVRRTPSESPTFGITAVAGPWPPLRRLWCRAGTRHPPAAESRRRPCRAVGASTVARSSSSASSRSTGSIQCLMLTRTNCQ
jgi:hypothetical protein